MCGVRDEEEQGEDLDHLKGDGEPTIEEGRGAHRPVAYAHIRNGSCGQADSHSEVDDAHLLHRTFKKKRGAQAPVGVWNAKLGV